MRIAEALRARGLTVLVTREPGGTPGAEAIRALLMNGDADRWSPRVEALLFAAARADHVERIIRPALARGDWVICDRFIDSTRAYQGGAGGVSDDEIMALHGFGSEGLLPDRTLLFALPPTDGIARATLRDGAGADRFAARGLDFARVLDAAFARIAADDPARYRVIDASGSVETVTAASMTALNDLS